MDALMQQTNGRMIKSESNAVSLAFSSETTNYGFDCTCIITIALDYTPKRWKKMDDIIVFADLFYAYRN